MVKIIELDDYTDLPWGEMVMFDSVEDLEGRDGTAYHIKDSAVYYYEEIKKENRND